LITFHETEQSIAEIGHVGPEFIFGTRAWWPSFQMDNAYTWLPLNNFGHVRTIAAREDINSIAAQRKVAAHFIDIDILPTSVRSPEQRYRTGVFAQKRYTYWSVHLLFPLVVPRCIVRCIAFLPFLIATYTGSVLHRTMH